MSAKQQRCNRRHKNTNCFGFEKLEPRQLLAVTANFNPFFGLLAVGGDGENDTIVISRTSNGQIRVNGNNVSIATVNTTNTLFINAGNGNDSITIDQSLGEFAPGSTSESSGFGEIEFSIDGQLGADSLTIIGKSTADIINIGVNGINLNNDNDADVTLTSVETINVQGGFGDDVVRVAGSSDVGGPVTTNLVFDGGDGDDAIVIAAGNPTTRSGNVTVVGGRGSDSYVYFGSDFADQISADLDATKGQLVASLRPSFLTFAQIHRIRGFENFSFSALQGDDQLDFSAISSSDYVTAGINLLQLDGGPGVNTIRGSEGADNIDSNGVDNVFGLGGNDSLTSIAGSAFLSGGSGNDKFFISGARNSDTINGDLGNDTLNFTANIRGPIVPLSMAVFRDAATNEVILQRRFLQGVGIISEARARGIEALGLSGGDLDDELDASALTLNDILSLGIADVIIHGNSGNDLLIGSAASDIIVGFSGNDTLIGLQGDDSLNGSDGNDQIFGGPGNDILRGGPGNDTLFGDAGNDQLFGEGNDDTLHGGDGNDTLDGGPGNNILDEGPGQGGVVFNGTPGNDVIRIGRKEVNGVGQVVSAINGVRTVQPYTNGETIIVHAGAGHDRVVMAKSAGLKWQAEFHGEDGNDTLRGGNQDDLLFGGPGNDRLFGELGNDVLSGGNGNDRLFGQHGRDLLIGGRGRDLLFGTKGDDLLIGGFTSHDSRNQALRLLSNEWKSSSTYESRAQSIQNGTGSNLAGSGVFLRENTSVFNDGKLDRLFGQADRDLFFTELGDHIYDIAGNEWVY